MSGAIDAIWIKRFRRGPMDAVTSAEVVAGRGLVGNANQGGRRQITIIAAEAWGDVVRDLGAQVPPSARRANVLVRGVDLAESRGRILRLGACRVRVYGETRPCHLMDEACAGLQAALRPAWRGGVFAEVLDSGRITVGDPATWEEAMATPDEADLRPMTPRRSHRA